MVCGYSIYSGCSNTTLLFRVVICGYLATCLSIKQSIFIDRLLCYLCQNYNVI